MSHAYATAIATLSRKIAEAKAFADRDLTPEAMVRRRQEMASAAREEFEAAIPTVRTDLGTARADYIAAAFPKTADELALATGLLDLVGRKVAAGQPFARVLAEANEPTLRAVVALPDGLTGVKGAPEGPEAAQALQEQAFGVLAQIDGSDAQIAAQRDAEAEVEQAWGNIMRSLPVVGVDGATLSLLITNDRAGYEEAFGGGIPSSLPADLRNIEQAARQAAQQYIAGTFRTR